MLVTGSGAGGRAHEAEQEGGRTSHTSLGRSVCVCVSVEEQEEVCMGGCSERGGAQVLKFYLALCVSLLCPSWSLFSPAFLPSLTQLGYFWFVHLLCGIRKFPDSDSSHSLPCPPPPTLSPSLSVVCLSQCPLTPPASCRVS